MLPDISRAATRLARFFLVTFAALALVTAYWSLVRREEVTARADNPRSVLRAQDVRRGEIQDRDGTVLAETQLVDGVPIRAYPVPAAAHVVGYASVTYGVAGIEAAFDSILRGDEGFDGFERWLRLTLLHEPQVGRAVVLTVDTALQNAAAAALGSDRGAVVMLESSTGRILALASAPSYDPGRLDEEWERLVADGRAPLLNRATLGRYAPGSVLAPFAVGTAIDVGALALRDIPSGPAVWSGVSDLTASELESGFRALGLLDAPVFSLPVADPGTWSLPDSGDGYRDFENGASGVKVSPLQVALAAAAIANGGIAPAPVLATAFEDVTGELQPIPPPAPRGRVMSLDAAEAVESWMRSRAGAVPGGATGYTAFGGALDAAWYWGFDADRARVIVVVLEEATEDAAAALGAQLLSAPSGGG